MKNEIFALKRVRNSLAVILFVIQDHIDFLYIIHR